MSPGAIELIDATEPYQGGNDDLWKLHKLNNIDKHNLLLVIACDVAGATVTFAHDPATMQSGGYMMLGMPGTSSGKMRALQDGTIIGGITGQLKSGVHEYFNIAFEVSFGQSGVSDGEPALPLLGKLSHLVNGIVDQFVPFL